SRANRLANALLNLGLARGSRIAFMAGNRHEFAEAYFGISKTGLVINPVNALFSQEDAAYVINHSDAAVLIYQQELKGLVDKIKKDIPQVKHFISLGDEYESFLQDASDSDPKEQELTAEDDLYMIMYTSGATGKPKGVGTSQRSIVLNAISMAFEIGLGPDDTTLLVMPLFHNGGLWPTVVHFLRGGTVILYEGSFDAERVLEICEKEKITFLNLVPTTLYRVIEHPDLEKYNLTSLRSIMYAGAPSSLDKVKEAMGFLGQERFYQGLGSTEHNGVIVSFPTYEHALTGPLAEKLSSVGRTATLMEVRVVDDNGDDVQPGGIGEIICRGNLALGYWKQPEETKETFKDGWLYTGDVGRIDADSYIYGVDRKKDMIISGGENIASKEVEDVICRHPAVYEAAVIGVPDPQWGEAVKAVVALKPGMQATEKEIIDFTKNYLASYKKPKSVEFCNELPKNPAGKIMKGEIKKKYWEGTGRKI
ncbi:MAG: AMP-binding protein, partial [Syntrophales bacterium]|nr:AMP-binding protein [Syntrophales bacterium]